MRLTKVQVAGVFLLVLFLSLIGREGNVRSPSPLKDFKGTYVVMVDSFDDRNNLPKHQLSILTSPALAKWLDAHATAWRKLDAVKDADGQGHEPWVAAAMARAKGKPTPWMGVWSEKGWWEGPLEENLTAFEGRVSMTKEGQKK